MAKHNAIIDPRLQLPNLLELNLAYNQLITFPKLDGVPNLEVLILSHNRMEGKFTGVARCRKLKRLDLSSNLFQLTPSQLQEAIK